MRKIKGPHSYEELRAVVIDILLGKEKIKNGTDPTDAKAEIGEKFGKSMADLNKRLK